MKETSTTVSTPGSLLVNGAKAIGELAIVPGASQIVDGQVKSGLLHAAGGIVGLAMLGPVLGPLAWIGFAADSYSKSVAGKSLQDQFKEA